MQLIVFKIVGSK